MHSRNPLARKHGLLTAAVFFLLLAGFIDPQLLPRLACHVGVMTVAFLVACGFLAAKGIGKLAGVFLRGPIRPWYARSGLVIFLCVALPAMNILFIGIDNLFINARAMGQVTCQQARMFVFMALELLWIVLLA